MLLVFNSTTTMYNTLVFSVLRNLPEIAGNSRISSRKSVFAILNVKFLECAT